MEDKRKRTLNFTQDEKSVLKELIVKYKDIIENKNTDGTTNGEKLKAWKRLTEEFNALSSYCGRTPESLKTCWENIKRQSKKESATRKRELFKTGGGRPPPPAPGSGADRLVEDILGPALEGLENPYDCDALLDDTQIVYNTDDCIQNSSTEINQIIVVESEPSCSSNWSEGTILQNKKQKNEKINTSQPQPQLDEENDNNLKWQGWTPKSLKRPISDILATGNTKENKSWIKRRRPDQQNLNDQLLQEKINLVKTLTENAREESAKRMLILNEQLKQEKIKTQKMLDNGFDICQS